MMASATPRVPAASGAAPDATFTLARDHAATERCVREAGIPHTFLRDNLYLDFAEHLVGEDGVIRPFEGDTAIFITPGYRFRAIDGLMTNFHLPRSTLFMLVSALMGLETMQAAYAHAIAGEYRFYSYGDSSLLLPGR